MEKILTLSLYHIFTSQREQMILLGQISHLDECEHKQHYQGGKQERTQEAEVFAPPHSPESVSSQAKDNHCCQNCRLQNDLACPHKGFTLALRSYKKQRLNRTEHTKASKLHRELRLISRHVCLSKRDGDTTRTKSRT